MALNPLTQYQESLRALREHPGLLSAAELSELPAPTWLVDGLIPSGGLSVLYGAPSTGKSFLSLALALSIATGVPWLGRTVEAGPVIYIAGEGNGGMPRRQEAWFLSEGVEDAALGYYRHSVDLLDPEASGALASVVRAIRPRLIVIDTLARTIGAGDESGSRDMNRYVAAVDRVRGDAAALVVHHVGHDKTQRERGHSALRGAADCSLRLKRADGGGLTLSCEKMKEAKEWEPIGLRLQTSGESCVVIAVDDAVATDALLARVIEVVRENPGAGQRQVRDKIGGQASHTDAALRKAVSRGQIENRATGRPFRYHVVSDTLRHTADDSGAADSQRQPAESVNGLSVRRMPLPVGEAPGTQPGQRSLPIASDVSDDNK